jgi:hypothetical protein
MNGDGKIKGSEIKTRYKELKIKWVGRGYDGLNTFLIDAKKGICRSRKYQYSKEQIHNNRWFSIEEFLKYYK